MKLENIPFQPIDWLARRTVEAGNVRARVVDYPAGYIADHWCERGHVLYVLEGEVVTELRDGRSFTLKSGHGYVVADGDGAHRSRTTTGARLFIVD
jgi:quercetin dioxygenase-like cupin family protein